jgi:hypothetical protein
MKFLRDSWYVLISSTWFLFLLIAVAHGQEPRTTIKPADPISATVHDRPEVIVVSMDGKAPIIYPNPLPPIQLGNIARAYRLTHFTAPKATKVANDDQPIVAEEPKKEQQ